MEEEEASGIGISIVMPFDQAVMRTRIALRTRGFSILSEMPAPPSVGTSGRAHLFMSVWERLLSASNLGGQGLDVGDHLQCHVAVYEDGPETTVACLDPTEGMSGWGDLSATAEQVKEVLEAMLNDVAGGPDSAL